MPQLPAGRGFGDYLIASSIISGIYVPDER